MTRSRPWWTLLLVVNYLCGAHLCAVFIAQAVRPRDEFSSSLMFLVLGAPVVGLAVLVGWGVLAATWRKPGPRPAVDALVAAGTGLLVAPVLAVPVLVFVVWVTR